MKPRPWLALLGWVLLTFLAPALGASSPPDAWYASLAKPSWNPPSWIFAPVWTVLYLAMALAAWRVARITGWRSRPIAFYLVQLVLNALWTPLFFGWHQPAWAFVDIIALWLTILATLCAFNKIDRTAAWLLAPYLAWVTFASALNLALWHLNP